MAVYEYTYKKYLLQKLKSREKIQGDPERDVPLFNRVIRNGGLVQYIRLLERQKTEKCCDGPTKI